MAVGRFVALLSVAGLVACGGGKGVSGQGGGNGTITGLVVKGPIGSATVTAYPLDASMNRGTALANAATMPDGTFTLTVPPYNGALELVAFGGTYPEEAVGVPVQLTHDLSFVIPAFQSGASVSATISPVSSIARSLAKAAIARGSSLSDAVSMAWTHCNNHFGGLDWRVVVPTSLTPSQRENVSMSDATTAGLILSGLSQAARTMAETSSLSPGTSVTGGTLAGAGADDAADGTLDGMAGGVTLLQGSVTLNGYTFRRALGQAIVKFVGTSYNNTQLTAADVLSLANSLAADSDPYLFCPSQTATANCAGGSLEIQPPTISFVDPPTFVGTPTVTLTVQASDPIAPVTAVYAQTAGGALVTGTFADGVWTLADIALVEGPNAIYVWAVDAAGAGSLTSATQISVTVDTLPVSPYVNSSLVSYYDERPMTLVNGAVPPTYAFPPGAVKVSAAAAGAAYKAATRLGWATQPTPAMLEGANPDNIPFIQFAVPVSATRAPISAASYSISDGTNTYSGDLMTWKSSMSTSSTEYYDMPLSTNIVPSLATSVVGSLPLTVTATFTNAVGTSGNSSSSVTYVVIGPPLFIVEDAAYGTYGDTKSAFPYYVGDQTYSLLWASAGRFPNGQVRLVRYVLTNPAPAAVAVNATFVGSWGLTETYQRSLQADACANPADCPTDVYGYPTLTVDGQSFAATTFVGTNSPWVEGCNTTTSTPVHILGTTGRMVCDAAFPWAYLSDTPYPSFTPYTGTTTLNFDLGDVGSTAIFRNPTDVGGETTPPVSAGDMFVIPAAAGAVPGAVVVYVSRPYSARTISYSGTEAIIYRWTRHTSGGCCGYFQYTLWKTQKTLQSSVESLTGITTITTRGVSGTTLVGTPVDTQHIVSRSPVATH